MKNLQQIDFILEKLMPIHTRIVLFFSFTLALLGLAFMPPNINLTQMAIGFDISIIDDPKYMVSIVDIDLTTINIESNSENFSKIKKAPEEPKKTTIKTTTTTPKKENIKPVELLAGKDKIKVTLNNIPSSLITKSQISPPNGYFTNQQWKELDPETRQKYVDAFIIKHWKAVHEEYIATGVHPLIILVKGIDETNYGTSHLFYRSKNWGAIKYTEVTRTLNNKLFRKNSYVYAQDDCGTKDCMFFKFESVWEGRRAFSLFVKKERYVKHLKNKNIAKSTPAEWCDALYKGKYSTSNNKGKFTKMAREIHDRAEELGLPMYLSNYGV